jgi:hypothetical protein
LSSGVIVLIATAVICASAAAQSATYQFNNSLAADEPGAPSLVPVDPLALNGFETDTVFGETRTVYRWDGNATPLNQQAGLLLDTTSLITNATSYSLELVFEFTQTNGTWRRIFDTTGRLSDNGFYVEPGNRLQVYPDVTGTTIFETNQYHYIVMTVHNNMVKAYFDGTLELNSPTDELNILDPIVALFVDNNLGGPAQQEFADGRIAFLRISNGALSDEEIGDRAGDPLEPVAAIPLPAAVWLFAVGIAPAAVLIRRRRLGITR